MTDDEFEKILVRGMITTDHIADQTQTIADIGSAREYQKHEFCKEMDCAHIPPGSFTTG